MVFTVTYNLALSPFTNAPNQPLVTAWVLPGLAISKVYSNSMLALLNSRLTLVGGRNTGDPFDISEIRSEVLRTEIRAGATTSVTTIRRRLTNAESSESA